LPKLQIKKAPVWKNANFDDGLYDITTFGQVWINISQIEVLLWYWQVMAKQHSPVKPSRKNRYLVVIACL